MNKMKIAAVTTALMVAATPMTAFAYYDEAEAEEIEIVNEVEESAPEDAEIEDTESDDVEDEDWGLLTPDGNMELVDDYGSIEAGGKQFVTVTTKNGNYFYLIIDRDDDGNEKVHFLNQVDEADLLALMDDDEKEVYEESKEEVEKIVAEEKEETEEVVEVPEKNNKLSGIMALTLIGTIGGIAGYFYFKNNKKEKTNRTILLPNYHHLPQ